MYKGEGWALDVMRRGKETVPGTMEFLIAEAVAWAKVHGYRQMSLGLAPLAGLVPSTPSLPSSSFVERSAAYLHQRGVLLGQYRSLYAFKAKFQPRWEERYLIVSERQSLPQVLLALARVHGYDIRYMLRETWNTVRPLKSLAHLYARARFVKEEKQVS
jgi:phosphatidylglycerol lysyltransferase